jgi:hypothetical protein
MGDCREGQLACARGCRLSQGRVSRRRPVGGCRPRKFRASGCRLLRPAALGGAGAHRRCGRGQTGASYGTTGAARRFVRWVNGRACRSSSILSLTVRPKSIDRPQGAWCASGAAPDRPRRQVIHTFFSNPDPGACAARLQDAKHGATQRGSRRCTRGCTTFFSVPMAKNCSSTPSQRPMCSTP